MALPRLQSGLLEVAGYGVFVRSGGHPQATPVVLIHGVGMSGKYFEPLARELLPGFRVVIIDLPGFGRSPKPPRTLGFLELTEVIRGLIDALGLRQPVVVGHSMGCELLIHLLRLHPTKARGGVLLAPTINRYERNLALQTARLIQDGFREPPSLNLTLLRAYLQCGAKRYLQTVGDMFKDDTENLVTEVQAPLVIVRGTRDPIVTHEWVQLLAQRAPHARLHELERAPHALHYHSPAAVARLIYSAYEPQSNGR